MRRLVSQVLWYGQEFRFELSVPVEVCLFCQDTFTADPLSVGCFPGSPGEAWDVSTAPTGHVPIWFDLDLVTNLESASNEVRRFSVLTWAAWIESIHRRNLCDTFLDSDRLRKCLGDAIREAGYHSCALTDWKALGAKAYPTGLFSNCGGCWLAGQPCKLDGKPLELSRPLHSVFVDGNFKLPHLKGQTKQLLTEDSLEQSTPPNNSKFIPNSVVLSFMREKHNIVSKEANKTCSDFEADAEIGRFSKVYDITGIMGVFCRHGYCGAAINMFTGERYCYALLVLYVISIQQQIVVTFLWYDINCRFKSRWPKWLANLEFMGYNVLDAVWSMRFPLPPFHKYAHSAGCQLENSCGNMKGAGRPPGKNGFSLNTHFM